MPKWIRNPGPGEFRGEGKWLTIEQAKCSDADWEWNRASGYLPTHEGDEPPIEPDDAES